jgi:hypothetical protein
MLRPDPAQRPRLTEIRDNLQARMLEAEREGWLGEMEGLEVSLAGAQDKLAQLDVEETRQRTIDLGMPTFSKLAGRTSTANLTRRSTTHQLRSCGRASPQDRGRRVWTPLPPTKSVAAEFYNSTGQSALVEVHPPTRLSQPPHRTPPYSTALVVGEVRHVNDAWGNNGPRQFADLDRRLR